MQIMIKMITYGLVVLSLSFGVAVSAKANDFKSMLALANKGDATAQNNLGTAYGQGHGVRQDLKKAKEWFGKACDNGDQYGCINYRRTN